VFFAFCRRAWRQPTPPITHGLRDREPDNPAGCRHGRWLARCDFSRCLAKQSHNAYVFEQVTIYYPWHPLRGRSFRVQKRLKDRQGDCIFIRLPNETTCGLPAWMFSPDCMQFTIGRPHVAVDALLELRDLMMALHQAPQSDLGSLKMLPKEGTHETSAGFRTPATQFIATGPAANSSPRRTEQRTHIGSDRSIAAGSQQPKTRRRSTGR